MRILGRSCHVTVLLALLTGAGLLIFYYFPVSVSQKIDTSSLSHWPGHAYVARDPKYFHSAIMNVLFPVVSDSPNSPRASRLQLYEQSQRLGPPHSQHADIENQGQGRFSNWNGYIVFSASDNSNPASNGRTYTAHYPIMPAWWLPLILLAIGGMGLRWFARVSGEGADTGNQIDRVLSKVSAFVLSLFKTGSGRYWFWGTAIILWLYLNFVFVLLLPAANLAPDSATYVTWSPARTLGYTAFLHGYHLFFESWKYLPLVQLNFLFVSILALAYAIARIWKNYICGWFFLVLASGAGGAMLLSSADMLTEGVFAGVIMLHLACLYLFLNGSRAYAGLLAGCFLAAAILLKSVATAFLGPVALLLIFLRSRRMTVLAFIFCPAFTAWLAPSVYNYVHDGFFESTVIGGYALGGYVAWGIRPHPGSAYPVEAKLIEQRLAPILAKRPAHFKNVREYLDYTLNEYNLLLWGNMVPELVKHYGDICSNVKRNEWMLHRSGDKCLFQINKTLFQLAKEAIINEPQKYAYEVLANYYGMWGDVFESTPTVLEGVNDMAASQPAAYSNKTIYTQQLYGPLPAFQSVTERAATVSRIQGSSLTKLHDLLTLQGMLPIDRLVAIINQFTPLVIGIGILASLLLFGLRWIPPAAQAFCYTGLFVNAYFLGTALAQPALFRYAMTMQGAVLALLLMGAFLVIVSVYHLFASKKKKILAGIRAISPRKQPT